MSKHFVQNRLARWALLQTYRAYARAQVWRTGPRVFVNSVPKAGTHLLTAELQRWPGLMHSRLHIETARIFRDNDPPFDVRSNPLLADRLAGEIACVRAGQYFTGHVPWTESAEAAVSRAGARAIFVVRDPRDILVSNLHYLLKLRRHRAHAYFSQALRTEGERYDALIAGRQEGFRVLPFREVLASFGPWIEAKEVLTVRFEDLVGARGGGSTGRKRAALGAVGAHIGLTPDETWLDRVSTEAAGPTATLRKGQIGSWRTELPAPALRQVEDTCGDVIAAWGYELTGAGKQTRS